MRNGAATPWYRPLLERALALVPAPRPATVVVRCGSRAHRVRLARGRFWAGARCTACGSRVDATRVRRIGRWILGALRPAGHTEWPLRLWLATASYTALALASAACVWLLADRWWPATMLLFGPRWVLLLPLPVLVPALLWKDRPLLVPLAVAALVTVGPVMGFHTGWRRLFVSTDSARDIRVMSFNVFGGNTLQLPLAEMLGDWRVDIAGFQECGGRLETELKALQGWYSDVRGEMCIVSRFPILEATEMEHEELKAAGGSGAVQTAALDFHGRTIYYTNVHPISPRAGFEEIRAGKLEQGAPTLQEKSELREIEERRASRWVAQHPSPRIVAGDFNSPPESPIFRSAWARWKNAFSLVGCGLGGTYLTRWFRTRIDHILLDDRWTVVRAWVGPDVGSDHAPILAEVRLR